MAGSTFFDESTDQSQVKTAIVSKYFWAWAHVISPFAKKRGTRIAYIDLFTGPGRYKDGTKSTPLLILEQAAFSTAGLGMIYHVNLWLRKPSFLFSIQLEKES